MTRILPVSVIAARKKRQSGKDKAWEECRKVYTPANMDSKEHMFADKTGNASYEFYPEEIHEALRVAYNTVQEVGSPNI